VIARDMDRFAEDYETDVLEKLAKWGFTGVVATPQSDCTYLPPTSNTYVEVLDTPAYLGRWYNAFVNNVRFTGSCITADYGVVADHSDAISLVNMGKYTSFGNGTTSRTDGFAVQSPDASEPGYFDVKQGPGPDGPAPSQPQTYDMANYLIMELGPKVEGLYDYALITSPEGILFVIARDMDRFAEDYETDVLEKLAKWGFTGVVATPQAGCTSSPSPSPNSSKSDGKGLTDGAVAAIAISVMAAVAIIVGGGLYAMRMRRGQTARNVGLEGSYTAITDEPASITNGPGSYSAPRVQPTDMNEEEDIEAL